MLSLPRYPVTRSTVLLTVEQTCRSPILLQLVSSGCNHSPGPILSPLFATIPSFGPHFVDFGPVLGRVAIVDNAPDTLVSIGALATRGIETRFNPDLGVGLFFQNQLFYRGRQNPKTKLYELNVEGLIQLETPLTTCAPTSSGIQVQHETGRCPRNKPP